MPIDKQIHLPSKKANKQASKMPVVTRSQSKNQMRQSETDFNARLKSLSLLPKSMLQMCPKKEVQSNMESLEAEPERPTDKSVFSKILKDKLFISDKYRYYYTLYKNCAKRLSDGPSTGQYYELLKQYYYELYKQYYYDNLRVITEVNYIIVDWFDRVFVINGVVASPGLQKLINVSYEKTFEFENSIKNAPPNPTPEEEHIIKTFSDQLLETRTKVEPYVSPEFKASVVERYVSSVPKAPVVKPVTAPRRSARLMNRKKA